MDKGYINRLHTDLQNKLQEAIAIVEELEKEWSDVSYREEMELRNAATKVASTVPYEKGRQMSTKMFEGALREGQYNAVAHMLRMVEDMTKKELNHEIKK